MQNTSSAPDCPGSHNPRLPCCRTGPEASQAKKDRHCGDRVRCRRSGIGILSGSGCTFHRVGIHASGRAPPANQRYRFSCLSPVRISRLLAKQRPSTPCWPRPPERFLSHDAIVFCTQRTRRPSPCRPAPASLPGQFTGTVHGAELLVLGSDFLIGAWSEPLFRPDHKMLVASYLSAIRSVSPLRTFAKNESPAPGRNG